MPATEASAPVPHLYWSRDGRTGSTQRSGGDRYLITRWNNQWLIHYLPAPGYPGVAQPFTRVPWAGTSRSLRAAHESCTEHARQLADVSRQQAAQWGCEFEERGF